MESEQKKKTFQCFLQQTSCQIPEDWNSRTIWLVLWRQASFTDGSSLTLQKQQTNPVTSAIMPLEKGSFQLKCFLEMANRGMFWVFNPGSVRREEVTRPSASRWPTRSSPPAWRPASPCTDSWRSGKHRRGNTATRDGQVSVCAAVGRRGDGEREEYSHFHRKISACSSVAFSHYSPPPTPRQDRRCYTNTPQVTI